MTRYTSATDADRAAMLDVIGVGSLDELFEAIPAELRLDRPLALDDGLSETECFEDLAALAGRNAHADAETCFIGAGMYDHYVPALVDAITQRSEFLTPYTPYQPEVSQGGLQVMFEFQTAISELTGLPVANASLYEGPSSVASAAYLAIGATKRGKLVASRGLHPHARAALRTYARGFGAQVVEVPLKGGVTDATELSAAVGDDTAAVFIQSPNFLGAIEDLEGLASLAEGAGALSVASVDPISLAVLRPPGECGVDVALGEGQPLGNRLDFGGPSFGFFAAKEEHLRRMPGRIAGETTDVDGRRGFVLALQTREQHIRREKATHNICTSQALNALAGVIYLAWLGKRGFVELGELVAQRTAYARETLASVEGVELLHEAPVFREFALRLDAPVGAVLDRCAEDGLAAGYWLGGEYEEYQDGLLVALTERRSKGDIDRLADSLGRAIKSARGGGGGGEQETKKRKRREEGNKNPPPPPT
ncbi:MAG: aminomethyl-transferring glycine dehydrogenase subunit GcvPA, partial [Solirubrobacterales bacterium]